MRTILLAGAAIVALGSMPTTANAGALYIAKHLLSKCFDAVEYVKPDANCAANHVSTGYGHRSSDDNTQKIKQKNRNFLFGTDPDDLRQINVGVNVVYNGDDNYQSIKQKNKAIGIFSDDIEQTNVGLNTVDNGDDNTQKIEQSNSAVAVGTDEDLEQVNVASNHVENGNGNYQSISQSNNSIVIDY